MAGVPGRTYRVEASTDLEEWTVLGLAGAQASGMVLYVDTTTPEPGLRFYRLAENR
jgi:hypothetical protein